MFANQAVIILVVMQGGFTSLAVALNLNNASIAKMLVTNGANLELGDFVSVILGASQI